MEKLRDDFLFGKEQDLIIRRIGSRASTVLIGRKDLIGVKKIQIIIEGGETIKYLVEGEVV